MRQSRVRALTVPSVDSASRECSKLNASCGWAVALVGGDQDKSIDVFDAAIESHAPLPRVVHLKLDTPKPYAVLMRRGTMTSTTDLSWENLKKMMADAPKPTKKARDSSLHDWFENSSGVDAKGHRHKGWVQVVSGKPCARQPGQKSTPKCVSSAVRASMTTKQRRAAARHKRERDPNQPKKTGGAKPTYVPTFSKRAKGSSKKPHPRDACYYKIKRQYKVWPSAYASGALVKCRNKAARGE